VRFQMLSSRPARCRLRAMPRPMAPRPMNPTVTPTSRAAAELVHQPLGVRPGGVALRVRQIAPLALGRAGFVQSAGGEVGLVALAGILAALGAILCGQFLRLLRV